MLQIEIKATAEIRSFSLDSIFQDKLLIGRGMMSKYSTQGDCPPYAPQANSIQVAAMNDTGNPYCGFQSRQLRQLYPGFNNYFLNNTLLYEGTFTSFFKDKRSNRSHKTVGIKVFYYFCLMIEGSGFGSIPLTNGSGIQQAKKHTDPTDPDSDPDPQPCF